MNFYQDSSKFERQDPTHISHAGKLLNATLNDNQWDIGEKQQLEDKE